jgi:hypothetical protein
VPQDRRRSCAGQRFAATEGHPSENGWLDPESAKPEEAVLEFRDNVDFTNMAVLMSSRARTFKRNPSRVCIESGGYMVVFPYPDRPPWESGAVMMMRDFGGPVSRTNN